MAHLELAGIVQRYGSHTVVDGVSFRVEAGSIACLLGPPVAARRPCCAALPVSRTCRRRDSRAGTHASVHAGRRLPPEQRQIGMVFQDYALFPHLTVAANVGFGLAALAASERRSRVGELLATVGLGGQGDHYPHELSGGQQQRVALARALAPRPQLILLDEPFSNLDVDLRERLSLEVRDILKSQNITAVLVTHDQHEAFAMADEVGVMAAGSSSSGIPHTGCTTSRRTAWSPTSSARAFSCPAW
jgi:iron(III) transport system ATP-binding protein